MHAAIEIQLTKSERSTSRLGRSPRFAVSSCRRLVMVSSSSSGESVVTTDDSSQWRVRSKQ